MGPRPVLANGLGHVDVAGVATPASIRFDHDLRRGRSPTRTSPASPSQPHRIHEAARGRVTASYGEHDLTRVIRTEAGRSLAGGRVLVRSESVNVTEEAVLGRLLEQVEAIKMLVLRGDPEQLRRWYAPGVEVVSRHGTYIGVDAVVDRFREALANGTFEAIRTTWSVEDDDTIALQSLIQYSSGGRLVEFETMAMLRFNDDVVVVEHEFFDVKDLERQLAED